MITGGINAKHGSNTHRKSKTISRIVSTAITTNIRSEKVIRKIKRRPELWSSLDDTVIESLREEMKELRGDVNKVLKQSFEQNQRS